MNRRVCQLVDFLFAFTLYCGRIGIRVPARPQSNARKLAIECEQAENIILPEVEEGFIRYLLPRYATMRTGETAFQIRNFVQEVMRGDTDVFMKRLQSFFADTPYELARDLELHYQNVLFIVFKLLGFYVQVEYHTSQGRIDLVLKAPKCIYVMEFKLEVTAEEALQQIEDKQYALPFATDSRPVYKVGVNFSRTTRNIERWMVKE